MLVAMGGAYSRPPWRIVKNIGTPDGCNNAASVKKIIVLHLSGVRLFYVPYRGWRESAQRQCAAALTAANISPLRGAQVESQFVLHLGAPTSSSAIGGATGIAWSSWSA
jgi:hypothetical protein